MKISDRIRYALVNAHTRIKPEKVEYAARPQPAAGQMGLWDEKKHPRGQHENAGQFAPKGSAAGAGKPKGKALNQEVRLAKSRIPAEPKPTAAPKPEGKALNEMARAAKPEHPDDWLNGASAMADKLGADVSIRRQQGNVPTALVLDSLNIQEDREGVPHVIPGGVGHEKLPQIAESIAAKHGLQVEMAKNGTRAILTKKPKPAAPSRMEIGNPYRPNLRQQLGR